MFDFVRETSPYWLCAAGIFAALAFHRYLWLNPAWLDDFLSEQEELDEWGFRELEQGRDGDD